MPKLPLTLIAHNIRSAHNVGSLFRTGDGAGIEQLILSGITPHPRVKNDTRPPYVIGKNETAIAKTALGAEKSLDFDYSENIVTSLQELKRNGRKIYALEQTSSSTSLFDIKPQYPAALVLGEELLGVGSELLELADEVIEIPMFGQKESLNVSLAAAIALFWFRSSYK